MRKIKYITGRGGDARSGLSLHLETLTDDYSVLAVDPVFLRQSFHEQVSAVRDFCTIEQSNIIANSFGAYLLLQSLIGQPSLTSRVLLLSPVLGRVTSEARMLISIPPGEKALKSAIAEGRIALPRYLEILTGEEDDICDASLARSTAEKLGAKIQVLEQEGHLITPSKVSAAVNEFLMSSD